MGFLTRANIEREKSSFGEITSEMQQETEATVVNRILGESLHLNERMVLPKTSDLLLDRSETGDLDNSGNRLGFAENNEIETEVFPSTSEERDESVFRFENNNGLHHRRHHNRHGNRGKATGLFEFFKAVTICFTGSFI